MASSRIEGVDELTMLLLAWRETFEICRGAGLALPGMFRIEFDRREEVWRLTDEYHETVHPAAALALCFDTAAGWLIRQGASALVSRGLLGFEWATGFLKCATFNGPWEQRHATLQAACRAKVAELCAIAAKQDAVARPPPANEFIMPCGHFASQLFRDFKIVDGNSYPDGATCRACLEIARAAPNPNAKRCSYSQAEIEALFPAAAATESEHAG